jgi:cell pole-organizing protein PopZ
VQKIIEMLKEKQTNPQMNASLKQNNLQTNSVKDIKLDVVKNMDNKDDMRKKYEDMAKKFERMENVLLMEAKEVKGIKDRINEIDDVIAKKYINNKPLLSDNQPLDQGIDKIDSADSKEEMLSEAKTSKSNENDTVRVLPHRFRSKTISKFSDKNLMNHSSRENDVEKRAKDLQLKLRSMGDDSKTMKELVKMIRNSSSRSFVQTNDVLATFKNKFDAEVKKNLTKEEKTDMDKVTKMGYKTMPSLAMLKKNMQH